MHACLLNQYSEMLQTFNPITMKNEQKQIQAQTKLEVDSQTGLNPIQEEAAILLASGETITDVAAKIGVKRGTIYDWQGLVTFQCYYNQQRHNYKEHLTNGIIALTNDALTAIRNSLHSANESIQLKTATWLLEKIAEQKTGQTDVRAVVRKQCTSGIDDWGGFEKFDKTAYQSECKRLGIKPEP